MRKTYLGGMPDSAERGVFPTCLGVAETACCNINMFMEIKIIRWHNHLNPNLKKGPWTDEEDKLVIDMHQRLGNKWAKMAELVPGR